MKVKKCLAIFVAVSIFFALFPLSVQASSAQVAPAQIGEVAIAVETFSLSNGYIIEPEMVPIYEGDNVAMVLDRLLKSYNIEYENTGSIESGFYLSQMKYTPTTVKPPKYSLDYMGNDFYPDDNDDEWLGEFDYFSQSGWYFFINDWASDVGMSGISVGDKDAKHELKNGDVIRVQFTLCGLGGDLGTGFEGVEPLYPVANRDNVTYIMAKIKSENSEWLKNPQNKENFEKAKQVVQNLESSQNAIDKATESISKGVKDGLFPISLSSNTLRDKIDVSLNKTQAKPKETVTITVEENPGKYILVKESNITQFTKIASGKYTFVMPETGVYFNFGIAPNYANIVDKSGDGEVNASDLLAILNAYGTTDVSPEFNHGYDIINDGSIDASDLLTLLTNYGVKYLDASGAQFK